MNQLKAEEQLARTLSKEIGRVYKEELFACKAIADDQEKNYTGKNGSTKKLKRL